MARQRKRGGWLSSILGGASGDPPGTTYELHVLEGADSGAVFPLDQPQLQIGRRVPGENAVGIGLSDRSVSARHALVSCEDGQVSVEHLPSATNPTLVNGRRVKRKQVRDGDRIVLGLVVLELRAKRPPAQLREEAREETRQQKGREKKTVGRVPRSEIETDPLNVHGELVLREGIEGLIGSRFPLTQRRTSIGREDDCDIVLEVTSISRAHAALVWEDEQLVLIHESAVNPTHVNGMPVRDRRRLFHGDEVRISERVVFEVVLEAADEPAAPAPREEEATRFTTPPGLAPEAKPPSPAPLEEEDRTQVSLAAPPPAHEDLEAAEATVIEAAEATVLEAAEATMIETAEVDESADEGGETTPPEGAPTVIEAPESTAFSEGNETRVAPAPEPADYSGGDATRIAPAPEPADYSGGDATRVAPAPEAPSFRDGAATRIAPAPDLGTASDETRVAEPAAGDADATLIRPSPVPAPPAEEAGAERTRVVDLDDSLNDSLAGSLEAPEEAKTLIRPAPVPVADDSQATLIRPPKKAPGAAPPAQTMILEPDQTNEDASEDGDEDDERSS